MSISRQLGIFLLILISILINGIQQSLSAQESKGSITIEVVRVDTITLLDPRYTAAEYRFSNKQDSVQVVHFWIVEKVGKLKHKCANIIVTHLDNSEHICVYDFEIGRRYRMPILKTKYSSSLVRKKFRRWHYRTDCRNMPGLVR